MSDRTFINTDPPAKAATSTAPGNGLEPLAIGTKELARMLSVSVATLERWDSGGRLGPPGVKIGGRRLWPLAEVRAWVEAGLPDRETWLALRRSMSR